MSSNNNEDLNEILSRLKHGSILTQRKQNGEKCSHQFFLDEYEDFISYHQTEKVFDQSHRYYIRTINELRIGFHTLTFDELLKQHVVESDDEQFAFSIIYNNYRNALHLMANDEQTRDTWVQGLQYLIDGYAQKRQRYNIRDTNWILSHLRFADQDKSNTLTQIECQRLLTDLLNVELPKYVFETIFKDADKSGDGLLTPDEFIDFFYVLTLRKDLYEIMQKYVKNGDEQPIETICMNVDELLYFLRNVQNQTIIKSRSKDDFTLQPVTTREQVEELINEFEPNVELQEKGLLSLGGFQNLMLSDDFSLIKPWYTLRPYQDMTKPLTDYFINTSHNTYLFDNQVYGDSNPEAYNRALRAGCRVVELDCYDGQHGQPIVTHGYTLVKPCLFESIIRFMEPNLFKTSPYPVILSIENHCSIAQQKEMARILKEVLGDRLITKHISTKNSSVLPSPEDLKYKVLIRSVKISTSTKDSKSQQDEEIEPDLSDLFIYLENVPFREHSYSKDHYSCFHSSSLPEKDFDRISRSDPIGLLSQTRKCLLRVYPGGLRQDSSNPNPINAWNNGIQMVALNYQGDDHMITLSYGKFNDNGGCGYVLKPDYLINIEKTKFNPFDYLTKSKNLIEYPQRLIITVISAQFLSRASETTDDIPDPYVVLSTHGIVCDNQIHKTKFIDNNGLNPIWNETFTFDISFPQMCLVRFDVYDYDIFSCDDRLNYFCLPMTTMQTGYRHIHLRSKGHNSTFSSLFVHIQIENT